MRRAPSHCALILIVLVLSASPALADSDCAAGSLSTVMGTTCNIGSLQFTFSDYTASSWTPSNFTLTPVSNGFTLSFDGGAQSITGPTSSISYDYFELYYYVTDLTGVLTGESVSGGELLTSGGTSIPPFAEYYGYTCPLGSDCETRIGAFADSNGGPTSYAYGDPFSSGYAYAAPFSLEAGFGATASWDGTPTTFTYTSTPVPEPGSLLLFATGLASLAGLVRQKIRGVL